MRNVLFLQGKVKDKNKSYGAADLNKILYNFHKTQRYSNSCPIVVLGILFNITGDIR